MQRPAASVGERAPTSCSRQAWEIDTEDDWFRLEQVVAERNLSRRNQDKRPAMGPRPWLHG